ncbi:DUF202 domain-containing protein [Pendulispora albinea]|uniref:DUF202 domain-containing protein n=2 Tax=Pendulispora albinea TaxID=2741071 RepID=A0ABZ2LMU4_9BACT
MGFGFVVARFGLFMRELARMPEHTTESHLGASWVGIVLVVLGIVVNAGATVRYLRFNSALSRGEPAHVSLSAPAVLAIGVALIGLILTVVLLASLGQ